MTVNNVLYTDMVEAVPPVQSAPPASRFRIKRSGARPFQFEGTELYSTMSYMPGTPLWYEVNLYRTTDGTFVIDIRMFTKSTDEGDRFTVLTAQNVAEVQEALETYEPAFDVNPGSFDPGAEDTPIADLALATARLRLRIAEARRQFRDLAGELLYKLDSSAF